MARRWWLLAPCLLCAAPVLGVADSFLRSIILPEQRTLQVRDPAQLPRAPIPPSAPPRTVIDTQPYAQPWLLSLDEALQIALVNARVIRVLTGITAQSSGRTIYDAAIMNTTIDQERARFDPVLEHRSTWNRTEVPQATLNLLNPNEVIIGGTQVSEYIGETKLNQTNVLGGQFGVRWRENPQAFDTAVPQLGGIAPFLLNPQKNNTVELSYTQPLLQGGGFRVNTAPIVIARLNTERSFFQYKDSVQEYVRGVIEAYWNLVQARTDVWARRIQVQQTKGDYEREEARRQAKLANIADVAQTRAAYEQFRATLIAAEAAVLDREAALRNLLFLPPGDCREIIPVSMPTNQRLPRDWCGILEIAEQRRPDIVELKLILEADQVQLVQARNQQLPRLDAFALYRWNGLTGTQANGNGIASDAGQFTDWSLGLNFSVPLGLRQGRAAVRQQELIIVRDLNNLQQGLHAAEHDLALTIRELDSTYEQYLAFKESRAAALVNLLVQLEQFRAGRVIYLNVLQALNDWGNSVIAEAQALIRYNVALATLERKTGTILETHGLVFVEERFRAAGPLGIFGHGRDYPAANPPAGTPTQYPANPRQEPAENYFDLRNPAERRPRLEEAPPPRIKER